MSRRNSREAKAIRRKERLERPIQPPTVVAMSFCKNCGDHTHVYEPARWCGRCLDDLAGE